MAIQRSAGWPPQACLTGYYSQEQVDDRHCAVRQLSGILELLSVRHARDVADPVDLAGRGSGPRRRTYFVKRNGDTPSPLALVPDHETTTLGSHSSHMDGLATAIPAHAHLAAKGKEQVEHGDQALNGARAVRRQQRGCLQLVPRDGKQLDEGGHHCACHAAGCT